MITRVLQQIHVTLHNVFICNLMIKSIELGTYAYSWCKSGRHHLYRSSTVSHKKNNQTMKFEAVKQDFIGAGNLVLQYFLKIDQLEIKKNDFV